MEENKEELRVMGATMRTESMIRQEMAETQARYHEAAQTQLPAVWRPLSDRVKALQKELAALITDGAVPCSRCGKQPHGLRHVRATQSKRKNELSFRHVYEVGCIDCVDDENDDRRGFGETPPGSNGPSLESHNEVARQAAVANWNRYNSNLPAE